jgi:hypothetical protein
MKKAEWLKSSEPGEMLRYLQRSTRVRPSVRKLCLFSFACCGRLPVVRSDELARRAIEVAESFVEGVGERSELLAADRQMDAHWQSSTLQRSAELLPVLLAVRLAIGREAFPMSSARVIAGNAAQWARRDEPKKQSQLLRGVLGDPFRPSRVEASWLRWNDGTIPRIAQGIYEQRAFDRLPILHDALLDAGCDDEDILAHCRGAGPHVRGCWVIDLILGKS